MNSVLKRIAKKVVAAALAVVVQETIKVVNKKMK
jgi:hypothetical protein